MGESYEDDRLDAIVDLEARERQHLPTLIKSSCFIPSNKLSDSVELDGITCDKLTKYHKN